MQTQTQHKKDVNLCCAHQFHHVCVCLCTESSFSDYPSQLFLPLSLPLSLSLTLSLPPSLRIPIEQRKGKKRKKFETDTRDLSAGARVHFQHVQNGQHSFFFLYASTDACLFLPPSFLLSSPPLCCAGWMDGWSQKQTGVASGAEKKGRRASRAAGAAHVCDASPAL